MKAAFRAKINECDAELFDIKNETLELDAFDRKRNYFVLYALMKANGTLEQILKGMLSDYLMHGCRPQTISLIEKAVLKAPTSVKYDAICNLLGKFDDEWKSNFKKQIALMQNNERLIDSSKSLVDCRHDFAHGGSPNISIEDLMNYYNDVKVLLNAVDSIIT